MAEADRILMVRYLALSGLVGTYFELGDKGSKSWMKQMSQFFFFNIKTVNFTRMMKNIFYTFIFYMLGAV